MLFVVLIYVISIPIIAIHGRYSKLPSNDMVSFWLISPLYLGLMFMALVSTIMYCVLECKIPIKNDKINYKVER